MKKYCSFDFYSSQLLVSGVGGNDQILGTDSVGNAVLYDRCTVTDITRTALIALRTATDLDPCAVYRVPLTQIDGLGFAHIKSIGKDKLSDDISFEHPTFCPEYLWAGSYNLSNNVFMALIDSINYNEVRGNAAINAFKFGSSSVRYNYIADSVINHTGGNFSHNNVTTSSIINMSGGTFSYNTVNESSNILMTGGTLARTVITGDAQVECSAGNSYDNTFDDNARVYMTGGYIRYTSIRGTTAVRPFNVNLSNCHLAVTTLDCEGSVGTISNSRLDRCYLINIKDIPLLSISDCSFKGYSSISANNATRLSLLRCELNSEGRILISPGGELTMRSTSISNQAYVRVLQGIMNCSHSKVDSLSHIINDSPGSNRVSRVSVTGYGNIRFLNTSTNCRIYYCNVGSGGTIYMNGTSNNCFIYYSSCFSAGKIYAQSSEGGRQYYCNATSRGYIYINASTGTPRQYYCNANSNGQVFILTCTGFCIQYYCSGTASSYVQLRVSDACRMYACHASATSIVRLINSVAGSNLYYSSATAYYYMYITKNVASTTTALHGYGRRSYSATNPPNGTYVQNF